MVPVSSIDRTPYRRRMAKLGNALRRVAAQQSGVIRREQLRAAGVTDWAIRRAVEDRLLRRVAPGLYADAGAPPTELQSLWIAHLAAGPSSVVSHESAGRLWGIEGVRAGRPTVTVPHDVSPRPNPLCAVHRSRHLDPVDVGRMDNLPVVRPARTIVDLAPLYGRARLAAIVDHAHFQRIASVAEVGAVLARIGLDGRRGLDPLIDVLDERSDGAAETQSYLERLLGEVLALAGIREFSRQHPLPTDGSFHGWVDVYLAWARLIIEADGRRWHSRQADMRRDRERDLAAAERGVQTVRFLHEQLRDRPEECAERLARVVAVRSAEVAASGR